MSKWHPIDTAPLNQAVETKIDDDEGVRNVQRLVQRQREAHLQPLWWTPDGSMYVYYRPTHWREATA